MTDGRAMPMPTACDEVFRGHGLLRSPIIGRELARSFPTDGMPSLLLRLRALLGVSIRCEILCLLGSTGEILGEAYYAVYIADITRILALV